MRLPLDCMRGVCVLLGVGVCLMRADVLEAATAYAQLASMKTQIPSKTGTTPLVMDSVDAIVNMDLDPKKEKIIVKEDGTYFIMCVVQAGAIDPKAEGFLDIWFLKNENLLPNTGSRITVENGSWTGTVVVQAAVQLKAGDNISSHFSASNPSLGCIFIKPPNVPASSSVSFSMIKLE